MIFARKAASVAAISAIALAAIAVIPAQQAVGQAQPAIVETLPPVPVLEPSDGIVLPDTTEPETAQPKPGVAIANPDAEPRATSLAALVARHANAVAEDREEDCLARAVYFESKGEPLAGRLAVAQVVINRAESGRFPGTLCGVVKQPSQFSFVRGGAFPAVSEPRQWREAVAIAHIAINDLWRGPAENALYFHAKYVAPNWNRTRVASVGNHIFYR